MKNVKDIGGSMLNDRVCYVDMDGVLADFKGGFKELSGGLNSEQLPDEQVWSRINTHGRDKFFSELPWTVGGKNLWNYITSKFPNIKILSALGKSDAIDGLSKKGKIEWLNKNIPSLKNLNMLFTPNKHAKKHYSKTGDILIDDDESNIKEWNKKGGTGILHRTLNDTILKLNEYTKTDVEEGYGALNPKDDPKSVGRWVIDFESDSKPLKENTMKKSQLKKIIKEIVKHIMKEQSYKTQFGQQTFSDNPQITQHHNPESMS